MLRVFCFFLLPGKEQVASKRPVRAVLLLFLCAASASNPYYSILLSCSLGFLSSVLSFFFWLAKFGLSQWPGVNTAAHNEPAHADSEPQSRISTVPRTRDKSRGGDRVQVASWSTAVCSNILQMPEERGQRQSER